MSLGRTPSSLPSSGRDVYVLVGRVALVLGSVLLTLLVVEGAHVLFSGATPTVGVTRTALGSLNRLRVDVDTADGAVEPQAAEAAWVTDEATFEGILPDLRRAQAILGNAPFLTLATPAARTTVDDEITGTLRLKANVRARTWFLRTHVYQPADPVTLTVPDGADISPRLESFIDRFAFGVARLTINEYGERLTLPPSDAEPVILVAGDSVAFGALLGDDEHLASQLQRLVPGYQFVAVGIPGGGRADALQVMEEAATRYGPRIQGLVYVNCENDFDTDDPLSIADALASWSERHQLRHRILVLNRYVYRTMPEVFRESLSRFRQMRADSTTLETAAREAGFSTIDFGDIVEAYRRQHGSLLAGAALYIDHVHFSADGTRLVAERVRAELEPQGTVE